MSDQLNVPDGGGVTESLTWAPGWYPIGDDSDHLRWWDGREWTTDVATRPPGWYEHPEGSGTRTFFDGARWTTKIRRRASRRATRLMLLLALVGIALVVWGGSVASSMPAWGYPRERFDYYCSGEHDDELFAGLGQLIAIWMLLLVVSATATILWGRAGRGDWRMRLLAILGGLSTAALFPLWLVVLTGMDCSL